jgi:hypothetical protein
MQSAPHQTTTLRHPQHGVHRGLQSHLKQVHHGEPIRRPPFAGRSPYGVSRNQSLLEDFVFADTATVSGNHSISEPYMGGADNTHQTIAESEYESSNVTTHPQTHGLPLQPQMPGLSRFKSQAHREVPASQFDVEREDWESLGGVQTFASPETMGHQLRHESHVNQQFRGSVSQVQRSSMSNVNPAAYFGAHDPNWRGDESEYRQLNGSEWRDHADQKTRFDPHSEAQTLYNGEGKVHVDEIYVPETAFHRRPSDVTDAFSLNESSSRAPFAGPSRFQLQEKDKKRPFDGAFTVSLDAFHGAQNGSFAHSERINVGKKHEYGGLSRFQRHQDLGAASNGPELDRQHLERKAFDTIQQKGESKELFPPTRTIFSKDTPVSTLRFFNNGVEIDVSGCPLSKPGSPPTENQSGYHMGNGRSGRLDRRGNGGQETDRRSSPDTQFLESVGFQGKSLWDDCF